MKNIPLFTCVTVFLLCFYGCKNEPDNSKSTPYENDNAVANELTNEQSRIKGITETEGMIQALSGRKDLMAKFFAGETVEIAQFANASLAYQGIESADFQDLITDPNLRSPATSMANSFDWPMADSKSNVSFDEVWAPLLKLGRFEDGQFGVLKGTFQQSDYFEMETKFEGRMRLEDGSLVGATGYQILGWKLVAPDSWKVSSWIQKKLKIIVRRNSIFEDVTAKAFPDPNTLKKVTTATHQDMIVKRCDELEESVRELMSGKRRVDPIRQAEIIDSFQAHPDYKGCNDWTCVGQYPSVSSVDFDQDGFDDLFLTDRWQPPQLLRNKGNGTFEDVTTSSGIDVSGMVTCAYFFDYDNDGDADLFLGLSMVKSLFYENVNGTFKLHDEVNEVLKDTRFVNAVSVADINRDGLLDLYLSTYATGTGPIDDWIGFITRQKDQLKTRLKIERFDKFVNRGGPPNIVLMNHGKTFEWITISDEIKQYRGSYQSSWMDYDDDGDLDLYVCNDFSPDVFLRNDTSQGSFELKFVDVTAETIPTMDMGFGMGCSWGDFDNDADLDLYVSNMYSKAGNRIVDQIEGSDPRLKVAAHGNFLFENQGGIFRQIAGDEKQQQHVARVGWSFGGQFADFDNDGELDIYVPSGCYSAPNEVKTKVDL
jgi:hypothetical protein